MLKLHNLKCFIIVVKDNLASEFYFKQVQPLWNAIGIFPERFNAITPSTLPTGVIEFKRNYAYKYREKGGREFTETEKSCFFSHFLLWKKCIELREKIVILEHDCVPFNPDRLVYNKENWFKTFDKGAMGCYVIDPFFAELAIVRILKQGVCSGPLGELQHFFAGHFTNAQHSFVVQEGKLFHNVVSRNYFCAVTQIYHEKYRTSIIHGDHNPDNVWPYYIRIENAPDPLCLQWIQEQALTFDYGRESLVT